MVTQNGQTTNFTGVGTDNPKLVIPQKNTFPPAQLAMALAIEQWANNLVVPDGSAGFTNISQTYSVSGVLSVASGATGYLPPFFMPVGNQSVSLYQIRTEVRSGSCTIEIQHNGSNIATGIAVTTTPTTYDVAATVANGDSFQVVITAVSSADGLSCSFFFEV